MKHFLKLLDVSPKEIEEILNLADQLKYENKHNIPHPHLKGKSVGLIFQKSSTRTRVSFQVGIHQLGGQAVVLNPGETQLDRGESIADTARTLSRYFDGVMIRTFGQNIVEEFAQEGSIPVINGLTDFAHPCQVMADLMTIREQKGTLEGLKLCYIGDGNNMANSLIVGGLKTGMSVYVACPENYRPDASVLEFAASYKSFVMTEDPLAAAADADVLVTDVWASMGQEGEAEIRKKAFAGFQINRETLSVAHGDAIVLHCLPAHKGEEITEEVFEAQAKVIFEEAENRLHAQKAIMSLLMRD
ncbi:MAG TPA: ornithine carbamoyltransferase [Clostridiales bacterium]|jgi:ornithine carbamoyltransferase|nr:ornithine carbamoyltransferase [Clostridiales bacterium]